MSGQMSIETWALRELGYAAVVGNPLPDTKPQVLAGNFLDAYPADSAHRQATEDLLEGYRDMKETDPDDPDLEAIERLIMRYFETWFGPPPVEAADSR